MSSSQHSKQHLEPSDLAMLDRILARVNSTSAGANSFEHLRIASLLIRTFQDGVTQENDLLALAKLAPGDYLKSRSDTYRLQG